MPHVTIEYSSNLDTVIDMAAFCKGVKRAMMQSGLFELGAVRVRAQRCENFAIADELAQNAFLDVSVRIGAGRSLGDKKKLGENLFTEMSDALAKQFASPHFALSLEIREIDSELSWKKNSMHARLRGK